MRVIVTGSRDWPDPMLVDEMICEALTDWQTWPAQPSVIVHGDCPTGADQHAHQAVLRLRAEGFDVTEEPHPADWQKHGKAAGPIRNQEMVDLGADYCLAFPLGESRGTRDCMERARKAGIEVIDVGEGYE